MEWNGDTHNMFQLSSALGHKSVHMQAFDQRM